MNSELRVRDVMSPSPHTIGVQLSLADAGKLMKKHKIRHLPVLEGGTLVGVLSDRDVQVISSISQLDPSCILVEDAMSQAPYTVLGDALVYEVAQVMADRKLGSAVVLDAHEKVIGVFTTTDGMRVLSEVLDPAKKGSVTRLEHHRQSQPH